MDFLTATLAQLKEFCAVNDIQPDGDRRRIDTWKAAAIAFVEAAELTLVQLFAEADRIGTKYQDPEEILSTAIELAHLTQDILGKAAETTKTIAVKAVEFATCPKAIEIYRRAAYLAAMAVLLVICTVIAIGRMVIEDERTQAAIKAVKVKAVEFAEGARWRSVAFWEWVRSIFDREYQSVLMRLELIE